MKKRKINYREFAQGARGDELSIPARPVATSDAASGPPVSSADILAAARPLRVALEDPHALTDSPRQSAHRLSLANGGQRSFRQRVEALGGSVDLLLFRVGVEMFGIDLQSIEEVLDVPELHRIPEMAGTVMGVFHLRDSLVALHTPDRVLGVSLRCAECALVFRGLDGRLALAVDDVNDVLTMKLPALRELPGGDVGDAVLAGVVRRQRELIGVLDAEALLAVLRGERAAESI